MIYSGEILKSKVSDYLKGLNSRLSERIEQIIFI
jgi:hypothetical protein